MDETSLINRCEKYRKLTKSALKKAKDIVPYEGYMSVIAKDFRQMTESYLKDGEHYQKKKEYDTALASYAYAHAWIDALARLGLVDTHADYKLFTLYR